MNKKLYGIIIILTLIIIMLGGYIAYEMLLNEKKENSNEIVNTDNNEEMINFDNLLGYWYENVEMCDKVNATNIDIKSIDDNKLKMNLYITRIAMINEIEVTMNNNNGTFYAEVEDIPTNDDETANISGSIVISNDSIKLNIIDTNILYLENNIEYIFTYHIENGNLDNYNGIWYESEEHSEDLNPNLLTIKEIDKNRVVFDLYVTRVAVFENVEVYISNGFSSFETITYNGVSLDGNSAVIKGGIRMVDDKIVLNVSLSNVRYLSSGTEYIFTYKE